MLSQDSSLLGCDAVQCGR